MEREEIYGALNRAYFSERCDERHVLAAIRPLLRRARLFVDVGASLGQYTRVAAREMRGGRILAVEADPIRFEELERNCACWERETGVRCTPVHAALADRSGPVTFYSTRSNVSGGLFARAGSHPSAEWSPIEVPGRTLDELVGGETPDLVKIDVEGSELRVLRGGVALLASGASSFLVEVHSWPDPEGQRNPEEVFAYLRAFGYRTSSLSGKVLFHRRPVLGAQLRARALASRVRDLLRRAA